MNQPKVSIIIPVYNVEDYIGLTLDSLLNQTLKEIEIILIDDGSTDNSRQILDDYSRKYKNIRLHYLVFQIRGKYKIFRVSKLVISIL